MTLEFKSASAKRRASRDVAAIEPLSAAHSALIAALTAEGPPRVIRYSADSDDLQLRADYLQRVCNAMQAFVREVVDDTARNAPLGAIDMDYIDRGWFDAISETVGCIANAADDMAEHARRF